MTIFKELKDIEGQIGCLNDFISAASIDGQHKRAAHLFGGNEAAAERFDKEISDLSHQVFDSIIAAIHERLGENDFNTAWIEGHIPTMEQAIEFAQE